MVDGHGPVPPQRGPGAALVDAVCPRPGRAGAEPATPWRRTRGSVSALFPPASGLATSWRGRSLAVLAIAVGVVLSLARTAGTGPLQSIWEEDARDVLADALNLPAARAIIKPVAGYYIVFPRLLGEVATLFPVSWAAAVLSISAAAVVAVLAVQVYVASGAHLSSWLARLLVSAPLLIAPSAENYLAEIYNRPVCLHFFAMYALFWLLLWTPSGGWGKAGQLTTVGCTAASTILIIGYLPLALVRLILRRDRLSLALFGLVLAGSAVQFSGVLVGVTGRATSPRLDPIWALATYLFWEIPTSLLGFSASQALSLKDQDVLDGARHQVGLVAVSLAIPVLIVFAAIIGARRGLLRPNWLLAGLAVGTSAWLHVFMVSSNGDVAMRYVLPIQSLLFAGMVVVLGPDPDRFASWRMRPRGSWAPLAALGLILLVVSAFNYRWDNTYRHRAPVWTHQVRQAAKECRHKPALSHVIVRSGPAPFWSIVAVPCHDLIGQPICQEPMCEYLQSSAVAGRNQ
jgi:hypothetical protein